jgi:hypothetical protein
MRKYVYCRYAEFSADIEREVIEKVDSVSNDSDLHSDLSLDSGSPESFRDFFYFPQANDGIVY